MGKKLTPLQYVWCGIKLLFVVVFGGFVLIMAWGRGKK